MRALTMRVLAPAALGVLLAATPGATAQELGWPHWEDGEAVAGDGYGYRVVRADTTGDGWEEIEVSGTEFEVLRGEDGEPAAPPQVAAIAASRLYLIRGTTGIESAFAAGKIPRWARDALHVEERGRFAACQRSSPTQSLPCQDLYVVSRAALARIPTREITGLPQPATTAPIDLTVAPLFRTCPDYDKEFVRSPSYEKTWGEPKDIHEKGFDGTITPRLEITFNEANQDDDKDNDRRLRLVLRVKTALCVPWMVYLKKATFELQGGVTAGVKVAGTFDAATGPQSLRKELIAFPLGAIKFIIGPVPVVIPIDLPVGVGLDYEADAAGSVDVKATAEATFNRRYVCDPICRSEESSESLSFEKEFTTTLDRARVQLFAYADAGLRAALYHHKVAQITAGIRPGIAADAFYRAPGRGCGDADGIDGQEVVEGRLIDLDGRIGLFAAASVWKLADGTSSATPFDEHLTLVDLGLAPGSASVITPLFGADKDVFTPPSDPLVLTAAMRPCWPWDDGVDYRFSIDDTTRRNVPARGDLAKVEAPTDPEKTFFAKDATGVRDNFLEALKDDHGRVLTGHVTHRSAQGNLAPLGFLDFAVNALDRSATVPLGGKIAAGGWAFDPDSTPAAPVAAVELSDDSAFPPLHVLDPDSDLGRERPDVVAVFGRTDALRSGWSTRFALYDPVGAKLSLFARAQDAEGSTTVLAQNPQLDVILNDTVETAGEIDESDDGATYRGDTRPGGTTIGTAGYRDDYGASCGAGARSEDAVYRLRLAGPRTVLLSTSGSEFNTVLHVKRASPRPPPPGGPEFPPSFDLVEIACNDDARGTQGELLLDLPAGTYYVIVDGFATLNRGPFALHVSFASTNVALGKAATQASDYLSACSGAAAAVDGDTNGNFWACSVSHTQRDPGAFWQLDLGQVYDVARVVLFNRTDCCAERLSFFDVELSTDGATWLGRYVGRPANAVENLVFNQPARYVRVRLRDTNFLSLAEVQVWAY